jgi:hypothetical protein
MSETTETSQRTRGGKPIEGEAEQPKIPVKFTVVGETCEVDDLRDLTLMEMAEIEQFTGNPIRGGTIPLNGVTGELLIVWLGLHRRNPALKITDCDGIRSTDIEWITHPMDALWPKDAAETEEETATEPDPSSGPATDGGQA